jgi:hypothetical protein
MNMIGTLAAIGLTACLLAPLTAADAAPAQTNSIEVAYVPPNNPRHQPIYERLKERRALERLQLLLSPFSLPSKLTVKVEGCDGETDAGMPTMP